MPKWFRKMVISMGGLIAADALIRVADSNGGVDANNMWPSIVGCLAFDTPVCDELFFLVYV